MNIEGGAVVPAWKQPTAREVINERAAVSARDVHALPVFTVRRGPPNRHSMGCVLAGQADHRRPMNRPDVLEPDEADAGNRGAVEQLRTEWFRELTLHHLGIHA